MTITKQIKTDAKITQAHAVTSAALATIISTDPPEWLNDYLSATDKMFSKTELNAQELEAYNEAIAFVQRLMFAFDFVQSRLDGIVVAMLTGESLAFLREREVI